jgi:hypothetical protein
MLDQAIHKYEEQGNKICQSLIDKVIKEKLPFPHLSGIDWSKANFQLTKDPSDGSECLLAEWKNKSGGKLGSIRFNGDNSFYAEYDILSAYPKDSKWFVESVTAWGNGEVIKTDLQLLEAVSEES